DVARVVIQHLAQLRGVALCPGLDALHRGTLRRQLAAIDQQAADRTIGVAVVVGEAYAQHAAALEFDAARTLDLQEKELNRILDPGDLAALDCGESGLDLGAFEIRHEAPSVETPTQPRLPGFDAESRQIEGEQIVRDA